MNIKDAIELYLDHSSLRVGPRTLPEYRKRLYLWASWRLSQGFGNDLVDVNIEEMRGFFSYLMSDHTPYSSGDQRRPLAEKKLSASYIDSIWRNVRSFWYWLECEKALTPEQITFFREKRIPVPRVDEQIRPIYEEDTFDALIAACETDRDKAILYMLIESGLRVAELCSLNYEHVNLLDREARIRGKGGKWRYIFWGPYTQSVLARYVRSVAQTERKGALFCSYRGTRLTTDGVRQLFVRLAERAGVDLPDGAPVHALRHTFAHRALDAGVDALRLAQLMGHSTPKMTMRYTRENPRRLREIHRRMFERRGMRV